ncbi:MAG TPA: alpha-glucan family phosphorylase [Gemmatimonadaceae bacterium]|nr:alpha-glucan family phosphorylase [Gemmatimonadaceae bacterium]
MLDETKSRVAYFSMEICLEQAIPTYSGGLGVLAGDTIRSAADLGVPMSAVTLVHRKGYFRQHLDGNGNQSEEPEPWRPEDVLELVPEKVIVNIEGREVVVRAWRYPVVGVEGHTVPVYLLDTDLPENSEWDRTLTDFLYGGDSRYRLCQEVVLGMGGAELIRTLDGDARTQFHINEGHAALLTLTLLERQVTASGHTVPSDVDVDAVRAQCIFTTHTPVPAGHDRFPESLVRTVLGDARAALLAASGCCTGTGDSWLNMTRLALRFSHYANGVAMRHGEVSREMFPDYEIHAITNGVHALTWTSPPFRELFDKHAPDWRKDNLYLRYAVGIPLEEIRAAHARAKGALLDEVARRTGTKLDPAVMTIGFARRATPYKRADLVFTDIDRLRAISKKVGALQIVFAGKAHPRDEGGKELIRHIFRAAHELDGALRVVYLENYEMDLGALLTSGVDLWLNNPMKPLEASGTSGMKAAINGVPSLSVLDGWWVEGHVEGVTGWSIGDSDAADSNSVAEADDLYTKLERTIVPLFYNSPLAWAAVMRHAIALNGSFFNTQRMVLQYVRDAYGALFERSESGVLEGVK